MCLSEALLRIPDDATADAFIRDKLAGTNWAASEDANNDADAPLLMNAATWALMLTGRLAAWRDDERPDSILKRLVARAGEPVVRAAVRQAMRIMAEQFIVGERIDLALSNAANRPDYRFSFDMLGEAAKTAHDAERYCDAYAEAIGAIASGSSATALLDRPSLSIKLSALHPRYEIAQKARVLADLYPRLLDLALRARDANIGITIDAEESDRLMLSLALIERLANEQRLRDWPGLGLAVQAYQRRGLYVCDWLVELALATGRSLMVRLVKGAYWDSEIKWAQQQGAQDYPIFTRKAATDVSYLACAERLLGAGDRIYPQFATHNCATVAAIIDRVGAARNFEFQKLQGMGDALYREVLPRFDVACRVYAPVGSHRDLLPYLVRRLLENGANTSFVHRIGDERVPAEALAADPLTLLPEPYLSHPAVRRPSELFLPRKNSMSLDLTDEPVLEATTLAIARARQRDIVAVADEQLVREPGDHRVAIGVARGISAGVLEQALGATHAAQPGWQATPADARAAILERAAEVFEQRFVDLTVLAVREAGKTLADANAEVREAIDFLRYYAAEARRVFGAPISLPGTTGESNQLMLAGRGVFAAISPWNFPLAIFTGQVAAALAAGNAVIAKPAEQTPLIAIAAVGLMHQAGVPSDVLRLACGRGETVGASLVRDRRVAGVVFTGSMETARLINRTLAARDGPIIPLIAETGGINAMIADSSALPEQLVSDVIQSAFQSAGQRCSAARLLFIQDDIATRVIELLAGAMAQLKVGDPALVTTDIGPVIDIDAKSSLDRYIAHLAKVGKCIASVPLPPEHGHGTYVAPVAYEIALADLPKSEVFGPVLHVIRYRADDLDNILGAIRATGYALTLGIQSRLHRFAEQVRALMPAGNTYVNRNMIGAVVGAQPFGGEGLSGTGPKAGGPNYLPRFAVERTVTINTAAVGGNTDLMRSVD